MVTSKYETKGSSLLLCPDNVQTTPQGWGKKKTSGPQAMFRCLFQKG